MNNQLGNFVMTLAAATLEEANRKIERLTKELDEARLALVAKEKDAARYRFLREPIEDGEYPQDGSCWVVQYYHPKGTIPELKSAGFGIRLDVTVDMAIEETAKKK